MYSDHDILALAHLRIRLLDAVRHGGDGVVRHEDKVVVHSVWPKYTFLPYSTGLLDDLEDYLHANNEYWKVALYYSYLEPTGYRAELTRYGLEDLCNPR